MLVDALKLHSTGGDREHCQSKCHVAAQASNLLRLRPDSQETILNIWKRQTFTRIERV